MGGRGRGQQRPRVCVRVCVCVCVCVCLACVFVWSVGGGGGGGREAVWKQPVIWTSRLGLQLMAPLHFEHWQILVVSCLFAIGRGSLTVFSKQQAHAHTHTHARTHARRHIPLCRLYKQEKYQLWGVLHKIKLFAPFVIPALYHYYWYTTIHWKVSEIPTSSPRPTAK